MTRAAKRKATREAQKAAKKGEAPKNGEQHIKLSNPVSDHFPAFILGNSGNDFANIAIGDLRREPRVVREGSGKGLHLVICGAGPTLADHIDEYGPPADHVWGCNSAATWLVDNGHKCTHGFTVDQTPHMLEEWFTAPDIEYLLASSCHPHLAEYLTKKGRTLSFFHNFVGIRGRPDFVLEDGERVTYENGLYSLCYDSTAIVGSGLNAVTRAVDLACFMGYETIKVLGADCAFQFTGECPQGVDGSPEHMHWLNNCTTMHVDGGSALASEATAVTLHAEIDGRAWETKPDMAISAVWLVMMARGLKHLELIGDTLPNAIIDKPDEFLDRLPALTDSEGKPMKYQLAAQLYGESLQEAGVDIPS